MHCADPHCVCISVCLPQYESSGLGLISSRLRTTLNRIQESLIDMVGQLLSAPPHFFLCSLSSSLVRFYQCLLTHLPSDTPCSRHLCSLYPHSSFRFMLLPLDLFHPLYPFWPFLYATLLLHQCHHKKHYRSSISGHSSPRPFYTWTCSLSLFRGGGCVSPLGLSAFVMLHRKT